MKQPLLHIFLKKIKLFKVAKLIYFFLNKLEIIKKYKTSTGTYYLPFFAFKDGIKNAITNDKIFDEHIFDVAKNYISENSIVIDAGSNYGQYTILFSKASKNVEVYSFEANKFIYDILKKNIEINNSNAKSFHVLLGNFDKKIINIEKVKLSTADYGSQSFKITSKIDSEKIQALKIDDIDFKKKISLFKIDVEGMDYEVLQGAEKTIKAHQMPIIFEFIKEKNQKSLEDYMNLIKSFNYYVHSKIDETNYLVKYKN